MRKRILYLLLLFFQIVLAQEDFSKNWISHFSYSEIVSSDSSNGKLYVASNNSFFTYDTNNNSLSEFSTINGLASNDIQVIKHSPTRNLIFVGFKNGLVEIIDENTQKIMSLIDISSLQNLPPNNIVVNDLFEDGDLLYIATGFGVVEYDLDKKVFRNTFLISNSLNEVSNVTSIGVIGDFIIASIADRGIFLGNKKDQNLILADNWSNIQANIFSEFEVFLGQLIARDNTKVYSFNGSIFEEKFSDTSNILDFSIAEGKLSISLTNKYIRLSENFNIETTIDFSSEIENNASNFYFINQDIFFAKKGSGFLKTKDTSLSNTQSISPEGPIFNNAYAIDANNGDVWLTYGQLSNSYNDNVSSPKVGVSRLRNNTWDTFSFEEVSLGRIVNVIINPNNKSQVYFASFLGGLIEYTESSNSFNVFNSENSNLENRTERIPPAVLALKFSPQGNLWFTNHNNAKLLKRFSVNGPTNDEPDLSGVDNGLRAPQIAFSNSGNAFVGTWISGLVGYNRTSKQIISLSDEETNNIPFVTIRALETDIEGDLWLGTNKGLRVIPNPDELFEKNPNEQRAESIIFLDNGIPQELLADQFITKIAIDSENNKWVATSGAGVFQFSPDGQETLNQFTTSNSPLPSNSIQTMAVDKSTGSVFIATDKGLMEFKTAIVEAQENFDNFKVFPNPVRPEYGDINIRIEGLTPGANVKITDIEGNLVFEDQNAVINGSGSGLIEWDTKSFSGKKVASGVYLILITSKDQAQTQISKLLIVR